MRKTISLIALFSFVLLLVTSVVLYIMPHGRVAYWANWTLFGLPKTTWDELHLSLGTLFVVVGLWHTVLNWAAIGTYLKRSREGVRSLAGVTALLVTLLVVAGTFLHWPPMSWILDLNSAVKNQGAATYGEPPYGHAELSSLSMLIRNTGLDTDDVKARLTEKNIVVMSPEQTVLEIADKNGLTPQQLFILMQPELKTGEFPPMPKLPPSGLGRKTLDTICGTYGLDCAALVEELKGQGFEASAEMTVKEVAASQEKNPIAVYELIYTFSQ
nr:DUF4405 domain-containing protein [uncultured Desulfuromonas sp.]